MTEEMAVQETKATLPTVRGGSLFFDVAMFAHIQRVAQIFAASTMVPQHFQNNIPNCVIALNLADRMGVDPFMLFQNMYIVHGNPGIEAKLAIALTNGCGRFEPLQFKHMNKGDGDKWGCIAFAKDIKSGKVLESATVSIQMAKDEGWYNKSGSKWKTMPELMLEYRSAMFFSRVYCPEVLLGLKTRDELYDIVDLERGRNGIYGTPEQKATDLTEKIKGEPKYKVQDPAQDLKAKLDEGDKGIEGYDDLKGDTHEQSDAYLDGIMENEPKPTVDTQAGEDLKEELTVGANAGNTLEHDEPEGTLPDNIDKMSWLTGCRPTSSIANAKAYLATYKEYKEAIDNLDNNTLKAKLKFKSGKAEEYLLEIKKNKQEIAEDKDTSIPKEDKIPAFEKEHEPAAANGMLKYLAAMKRYKEKNDDIYAGVLMDNSTEEKPINGMNDVKNPKDQAAILGFMAQAFGE